MQARVINPPLSSVLITAQEFLTDPSIPEYNKARLIHLYLGKRHPVRSHPMQDQDLRPSNFSCLNNLKMYFDQMVDLALHVSLIGDGGGCPRGDALGS